MRNASDPYPSMFPTLGEFVTEEWLPSMRGRLKASTWDSYRRNLELHVLPSVGETAIDEVGPRQLNALYGRLLADGRRNGSGGLSPQTVRYIHVIVHGVLGDACDLDILPENPASKAKPPKASASRAVEMSVWDASQLRAFLLSVAEEPLYAALRLAAMTGMRRGEVLGLRWGDLDLANRQLVVRHTLISVGYEVQESTPKTHRPRLVELDPETAAILTDHRATWVDDPASGSLVFVGLEGRRIHPDLFTQKFDRLVARSGLPRIRLHDLRHTHATLGLAAGVPVRVMSERLGHASPEFTMKQYQHVLPGMQAAAAQQIADLVAESS